MKKTILITTMFLGVSLFSMAQTTGEKSSPDVIGTTRTAPANSSKVQSSTPAPVKNNNRETYGSGNIDNSKQRNTPTPSKASPQTEK